MVRALSCMAAIAVLTPAPAFAEDESPLGVRITSPLGRVGDFARMRIVAQIRVPSDAALRPVQFYVDGTLLKTDADGPPYAVEWLDENPFERREISVQVEDELGRSAKDSVVLEPFEIVEIAQVTSVLLEAGVYDRRGGFVSGLDRSSFSVTEDGVPQAIDLVSHEELPATFALLIDCSQSMSRRMDFVQRAATRLVDFLRPRDRVLVAPFARRLAAVTGPTDDRSTVLEAVGRIDAAGGTAIVDSLVEVVRKLPGDEARRAVVLITDGYDENSVTPIDEALEAIKGSRATVYVVGIGGIAGISLKGERVLRRIASETGGQAFFPPREEELVAVHERLATDAQNRYLITYTPSNQARDGTWRQVNLSTSVGYTVRTRTGYAAPEPAPVRPALEFTITDASRRYVDLTVDDFVVVEDGVEQTIEAFHEAVAPVSIVLALDSSGSMRRSAAAMIEAAREFVATLRGEDSLALMMFADTPALAHDLSTNREATLKAIAEYTAVGGTALYDALADSLARLERVQGRRVVVVLTDGRDENNPGTAPGSVRTVDDVHSALRESEATVFTIGLGARVDRPLLERLAATSGGEAYFPAEVEDLREQYQRIVENLRRRYVVSYTSTNAVRDGAWRDVRIRLRSPDLVVRSRGGYFAPER